MTYRKFRSLVYQFGRRIYYEIGGTSRDEQWWRSRNAAALSTELPVSHPHRRWLMERLAESRPFSSMLEFGCGTGPNLELVLSTWSDVHCFGIEINPLAAALARERLKPDGPRLHISEGSLQRLADYPSKSVEIALTDASLLYVGPDRIVGTVRDLARIARKKLYLLELHDDAATACGHRTEDGWVRNYRELLKPLAAAVEIRKIPHQVFPSGRWPVRGFLTVATFTPPGISR